MKKILAVISSVVISIAALTSCVSTPILDGSELIENLRETASQSKGGSYTFTNLETGVADQYFAYLSGENKAQSYYTETYKDEINHALYSDGEKVFETTEDGAWTMLTSDDEGYLLCNEKNPHPYSTGELFFYVPKYVETATMTTEDDVDSYTYIYDVKKINSSADMQLSEFVTVYKFDKSGNFVEFIQQNSSDTGNYCYKINFSSEIPDFSTVLENSN